MYATVGFPHDITCITADVSEVDGYTVHLKLDDLRLLLRTEQAERLRDALIDALGGAQ